MKIRRLTKIEKASMTKKAACIFMVTCWLVFFTSRACFVSAKAQAEPQWALYNGKDDEFSVLLPERPAAHVKLRPKLASDSPPSNTDYELGRMYGAYADGVVYVIMSFDRKDKEKLDDFIKEFQKYHRPKSEMTYVRDVAQDDVSGKQYLIKLSEVEGITHFYLTKKRIYVLQAVGDNENNPDIRRFLKSFTLNGKALVRDLTESSGAVRSSTKSSTTLPVSQSSTPNEVFSGREVTRRAIVVMRPEPQYTNQARMNNVTGKIVIRAVLSSSGQVDRIRVTRSMPYGLTERAVEALRSFKFIPAIKDGKFASQYIQIENNFGLY